MAQDLLQKALSKDSLSFLNKMSFIWMVMSLAIFFIAHYLRIDNKACYLCSSISNILWFIEDIATASNFPNGIRLQWLFLFFSMPLFIGAVLYKINDLKHGEMSLRLPIVGTIVSLFGLSVIMFVATPKDTTFGFTALLLYKIIPASFGSFIIFYGISVGFIFLGLYIKAYAQYVRLHL